MIKLDDSQTTEPADKNVTLALGHKIALVFGIVGVIGLKLGQLYLEHSASGWFIKWYNMYGYYWIEVLGWQNITLVFGALIGMYGLVKALKYDPVITLNDKRENSYEQNAGSTSPAEMDIFLLGQIKHFRLFGMTTRGTGS